MARFPTEELERLKRDIFIRDLVEAHGVVLKLTGNNLSGLCPFHADKGPSLVITPSKNLWNCLGACGEGGTVIDWVMKAEKVGFRYAVELLRNGYPAVRDVPRTTQPLIPLPFEPSEDDKGLLGQIIGFYHSRFLEVPGAREYLESRGVYSQEAVEVFQIGFSDRSLGLRLPKKVIKEGADIRGRLEKLGILRSSGHEHFSGSVVFPIFKEGKVSEIYGRKTRHNLRLKIPDHTYLPGPHEGVWNGEYLKEGEVILCESIIDALTFWVHGFKNVTASFGVNGFNQDHLNIFKEKNIQKVFIAYDRDEAGDKASEKLAEKLVLEGFEVFRILFPRNMDANKFACQTALSSRANGLGLMLRTAEWVGGKSPTTPINVPFLIPEFEEATKKKRAVEEDSLSKPIDVLQPLSSLDAENLSDFTEQKNSEIKLNRPEPSLNLSPDDQGGNFSRNERETVLTFGDRVYKVRGLEKNSSFEVMKVNIRVSRGEYYHIDTLDLYQARSRNSFVGQVSKELCLDSEIIKRELGKVLFKLEELQEELLKKTLEPEKKEILLSEGERADALSLLKDPDLLKRVLTDFEACGVVGEETNKLVGYLSAVSRKLEEPLAIIIQSSSSAGKSSLMEAILSFIPPEEQVKYSAMTGQSLYYMGGTDLKNKILAIAEEEGAEKASYALKLLQSEGELTIASTGKDQATGKLQTQEYHVEGPVMLFLTTTGIEIDEELLNRCIVLTVDEEREQTRAIHQKQRSSQTLEGLLNRQTKKETLTLHQNAQRLLRPLLVANPFAEKLTFLDDRTRTRRDHLKYLTLIRAITLLHQYQREIKTVNHQGRLVQYIEVTLKDIELANTLAHEVLGRSLDELPPQTRKLLFKIEEYVKARAEMLQLETMEIRFTRKEIREFTGFSYEQVRVHLDRLVSMEYILPHSGKRGQSFLYELLFLSHEGYPLRVLPGLIEVERLGNGKGMILSLGGKGQSLGSVLPGFVPPLGVHTGPIPGGYRDPNTAHKPFVLADSGENIGKIPKIAYGGNGSKPESYRSLPVVNGKS